MRFCLYMTYPYFQGEPSGFISKGSILGEFRRSIDVRGSPGHQGQGNTHKTSKARACNKARHDRASSEIELATQKSGMATPCLVARPCHHAQVAVRPTHGRAWGCVARLNSFRDGSSGHSFSRRFFFLAFPLALGF